MEAIMMNRVTMAERVTALWLTFFRHFVSEKRAVNPKTVVTPVEMRHSSKKAL